MWTIFALEFRGYTVELSPTKACITVAKLSKLSLSSDIICPALQMILGPKRGRWVSNALLDLLGIFGGSAVPRPPRLLLTFDWNFIPNGFRVNSSRFIPKSSSISKSVESFDSSLLDDDCSYGRVRSCVGRTTIPPASSNDLVAGDGPVIFFSQLILAHREDLEYEFDIFLLELPEEQ